MTLKTLAFASAAGVMLLCAPAFAQENQPSSMQDEAMPAAESSMESAMEKPAAARDEKMMKKAHAEHHADKDSKKAMHAKHSEKSKGQHAKHGKEHSKHAKAGHMKKEHLSMTKPKAKEAPQEAAPAAGQ